MRTIGTRTQYRIRRFPSAEALKAGAAHQATVLALAAVPTSGMRRGIYRFATRAAADAHAAEAQARAIAQNLRARTLLP